ncbi:hypothetical protein SAMN05880566_1446 [Janthinobacterium sp. TND4EL3]|uniref:hypothetical protein n=1 Tax=Janthinobacterium sp. TND4EL3 TaxID=1907311 RepID=UPI000953FAEF|nr:hypothetical protein [Janthinobacterium sp. TND4EL3]SIR91562.1 hypothetical protein SAMN05880566_1446 [Janthinobacterium sp. TND4EL3]
MVIFPDWAPSSLIEQLERTRTYHERHSISDPDQIVSDTLRREEFSGLTEQAIEDFRASVYRSSLFLPGDEELQLLERVLTDLRMKVVWNILQRREKAESDYRCFWSACSGAIVGWRGEPKHSAKERRAHFQKIFEHAAELQSLLGKSKEFHYYSINGLIKDANVEWLLDVLGAETSIDEKNDISYAHFCLAEVVPPVHLLLQDIAEKAQEYAEHRPLVLKPRSENAPAHYFVRALSEYLRSRYGQPLHEVVAVTVSVIFDDIDIDIDLVRKLVAQK